MKFKIAIIILLLFVLISQTLHGAQINEVMYNPPGADNNKEFIEIYLDNNESLENWTISDSASNDTLTLLSYIDSSYALIVENDYDYENSEASYYSIGSTIGNNLNNGYDEIYLFNIEKELVDSMSYDGTIANDNGFTLEFFNESWHESKVVGGTPGELNSIEIYYGELNINISNTTNNNSFINNSKDNISLNNSVCDINISLTSDKKVYNQDEKIKYKIDLNNKSHPYIIEYWIEDIFGNIVKNKYNTTNTNQKTWTPNCDKGYVFVLNSRVVDVECNDSNQEDNSAKSYVIIQCGNSVDETFELNENIEIIETYFGNDNSIKFGEVVRVKLYLSKGDTSKTAIEMYVTNGDEKISETTKFNMNQKQSELFVTLPLMINSNCNEKIDEGEYELVVNGLGVKDTTNIEIVGYDLGICKTITKKETKECKENKVIIENKFSLNEENKSKINSFYTLAKKKSDKIRLFANVECIGECVILLLNNKTEIEKRNIKDFSGKIDFNVSYYDEYILELSEINMKKNLTMKLETNKIKNNISLKINNSKEDVANNVHNKKEITIEKKDLSIVTGNVVKEPKIIFESVTSKSKKMIKYFFALIFVTIIGIIIWKKPF
jgi:hypothetical protein